MNPQYLPMLISSAEETAQIMDGHLLMPPVASEEEASRLLREMPDSDNGKLALMEMMQHGCIVNPVELLTVCCSMIPLFYEKHTFLRPDRRLLRLGDTATIILNPRELIQRVTGYYQRCHANQYMVEAGCARYENRKNSPEDYDPYRRPKKDTWKQEILLMARMQFNIVMKDVKTGKPEQVEIGSLRNIAIQVPVKDLIRGCFPEKIMEPDFLEYIESFAPVRKETKGWFKSFAGNVMPVEPKREWIDRFQTILPPDTWQAVSFLEKLYEDGDAMPRLALYRKGGTDKIYFKINRVDFHFAYYGKQERAIVEAIVRELETTLHLRFCHMVTEVNANLGTAKPAYTEMTECSECRSRYRNRLYYYQKLELDYAVSMSILGVNAYQRSWNYLVRISTPPEEDLMWYDADAVLKFFDQMDEACLRDISKMSKGDPYAKYHRM